MMALKRKNRHRALLYVSNYIDEEFSILQVDGTKVTGTGKRLKVPGHSGPARMNRH